MAGVENNVSTIPDLVCVTEAKNDETFVRKELCEEVDEKPSERKVSNATNALSNDVSSFKNIFKTHWKFLLIVVLLLPTLALVAACSWLQGIPIIIPIFIYPSCIISGCSFLIGTQRYNSRATIQQDSPEIPTIVDSTAQPEQEQPMDSVQGNDVEKSDNKIQSLIKTFCITPPPPPPPPSPTPSNVDPLIQIECRKLLWDVVGKNSFKKRVIWNKMAKKLSAKDIVDVHELSSLFGANKALSTKSLKRAKVVPEKKRILNTKKSLNISITLTHAKLSLENIKESLIQGNTNLPTDLLENLMKFAPSQSEEYALKKQGTEDLSVLDDAEVFFYEIITTIPMYKERIRTMLLKAQLRERIHHIQPHLQTIIAANKEVRQSVLLKQFLQYVLTVGNFMNRSTTRGFKISFLSKLIFIKSNIDRKTTFLDFMVKSMISSHGYQSMAKMTTEMTHVNAAAKIQNKFLKREMDDLKQEVKHLENDVEKINNTVEIDSCFKKNVQVIVQQVRKDFQSLVKLNNTATKSWKETLEYFGEEQETTMTHEQLFGTIETFLRHFQESLKKYQ